MEPPPLWLLALLLLLLLLAAAGPAVRAQAGSCNISQEDGKDLTSENVIYLVDNEPLPDISPANHEYFMFITDNVNKGNGNDETYFKWIFREYSLTIATTEKFENIEEERNDTTVLLPLNYLCGGATSQKTVIFELLDSNNHQPKLSQSQYEYVLPMPFPANFDLTTLYGSITGRDIDMTSKGVDAALAGPGSELFSVQASPLVSKAFSVAVRTRKELRLQEPLTLQLTVTDRGTKDDPSTQETSATVVITPNISESVFSPRFRKPLYTADLQNMKEPEGPLVLDEPIQFEEGHSPDLKYELDSGLPGKGHAAYFEVEHTEDGAQLQWKRSADPDDLQAFLKEPFALLVLTATNPAASQTGRTVIHLTLPGVVPDTTTTPEPCPTTAEVPTTTECPVCPTTPEAPTTTECPVCPTTPEPPTTTECPVCPTTPEPPTTTECPVCPTKPEPPTTTECPVCPTTPEPLTTTECPTELSTTECPICPTTPEPPTTTECPVCPTTDGNTASTDCPTAPTECPTLPTECPTTTECPECPCADTTTAVTQPGGGGSPSTATDCPVTCGPSTVSPEASPTTCPAFDPSTMCPSGPAGSTEPSTGCPECPESTSCPGDVGSTPSTEPGPGPQLQFSQQQYRAEVAADALPGLPVASPSLSQKPPSTVFSLQQGGSTPTGYLHIDPGTGEVTLHRPLSVGTHAFLLRAEAPGYQAAKAELLVSVASVFPMQLQVLTASEKDEPQPLLAGRGGEHACTYLADAVPEHSRYFDVNETTGAVWLLAVDRESEEFGGVERPTLRLTVALNCPEQAQEERSWAELLPDTGDFDARWADTAVQVPNNPNNTHVWVLLQDANDNAPVFQPAELTVGYPGPELAAHLRPPALFTAQATDADAGENAVLRYSLDGAGEAVLAVHPGSGAVYPREGAQLPAAGLRFSVRATDRGGRPGDSGTNTGCLAVTAVPLALEHLLELSVRGKLAEDAAALAEGALAEGALRVLSAAVLPAAERDGRARSWALARGRRSADGDGGDDSGSGSGSGEEAEPAEPVLRMLVYALQAGRPVPADEYQQELEQSLQGSGLVDARPPEVRAAGGGSGSGSGSSEGAVIALSVVLALALLAVAGLAAYFWAIRPRLAARASHKPPFSQSETSSINGKSSLSSAVAAILPLPEEILKKPQPAPQSEPESEPGPSQLVSLDTGGWQTPSDAACSLPLPAEPSMPRPSVMLGGSQESAESADSDGDKDEDVEARAARRKSMVTFNEAVDCIEIDRL